MGRALPPNRTTPGFRQRRMGKPHQPASPRQQHRRSRALSRNSPSKLGTRIRAHSQHDRIARRKRLKSPDRTPAR
jgi:hypothetical protein